jgi:lysine decarboxylase
MGGTAFQMSPAGSIFYDFYGPNAFKADVSISMPELGSLLDHSGRTKPKEYIARTFNADRSYIVTNGTSTANKIVGMYSAPAGSTVLVDRNCHKSLTHLMMMNDVTRSTSVRPATPTASWAASRRAIQPRNHRRQGRRHPGAQAPRYAVITNSTYDGLLYNTGFIRGADTPYIHFLRQCLGAPHQLQPDL